MLMFIQVYETEVGVYKVYACPCTKGACPKRKVDVYMSETSVRAGPKPSERMPETKGACPKRKARVRNERRARDERRVPETKVRNERRVPDTKGAFPTRKHDVYTSVHLFKLSEVDVYTSVHL